MSRTLPELRKEMDDVNRRMLALFARRMALAEEIGRRKGEQALPLRDPGREREILDWAAGALEPALAPYGERLFRLLMDLALEYEQSAGPRETLP